MKRKNLLISALLPIYALLCLITIQRVNAQDTTSYIGAQSQISTAELALHYYSIKWTDSQWESLRGTELEMVFLIDEIGEPFLRTVRGTEDQAIIDSLTIATGQVLFFTPATQDGIAVESLMFFNISIPDLSISQVRAGSTSMYFPPIVVEPDLLESDQYEIQPLSFALEFGINTNAPFRPISEYLKPGIGMDWNILFHWKGAWGFGMALGADFNKKRQRFPIDPFPNRMPDTGRGGYAGPIAEYIIKRTKKNDLSIRGELGIGYARVATETRPTDEEDFIQFDGLHLGAHLNYNLRIGKYITYASASDLETSAIYHGLNIYAGLRMRRFKYTEANGFYAFLGLGYRLGGYEMKKVK